MDFKVIDMSHLISEKDLTASIMFNRNPSFNDIEMAKHLDRFIFCHNPSQSVKDMIDGLSDDLKCYIHLFETPLSDREFEDHVEESFKGNFWSADTWKKHPDHIKGRVLKIIGDRIA